MVYQLLYYDFNDKVLVENYLRANGKEYYIHNISPKAYEYINSLPKVHYNEAFYSKDEYTLLDMFGLNYDKYLTTDWIFEQVIQQIKNKYKHYKVKLLNIILEYNSTMDIKPK